MKAETYLRYKGIHYESVPSDPRKSPSKKISFIVTKTGENITDSEKIIEFFEAQSKDKMNDGMTDTERVLHQHWFDGFRAIQSVQDKARVAGNGYSLSKTLNTVLDALGCSLRASQKAVIHVVALLVKGTTIPFKVRLVANRFLTR